MSTTRSRSPAEFATIDTASSMQTSSSNGRRSSWTSLASSFEKSRMSLMMTSSASPLVRTVSANSRCRTSSSVSRSRPVIPMTAFIGVRISWLIVARN